MLETFKDAVSGAFLKVSSLFTTPNTSQTKRKRQESKTREDCSFTASPSKKPRVCPEDRINMPSTRPKQSTSFLPSESGSSQNANFPWKTRNGHTDDSEENGQVIITNQPVSLSSSIPKLRLSYSSPRSSFLLPSRAALPVHSPAPRYCLEYYKTCSQLASGTSAEETRTSLAPKIKMSIFDQLRFSQGRQFSSGSSVASSTSRNSTINQCIRLKEKESYSRLLEQFTCRGLSLSGTFTHKLPMKDFTPFHKLGSPSAAIIHESRIDAAPLSKSPIIVEVTSVTSHGSTILSNQPASQEPRHVESTASIAGTAGAVHGQSQGASRKESSTQLPILSPDFVPSLRKRFRARERERQRLEENARLQRKLASEQRDDFELALEDSFRKQISLISEVTETSVKLPEITKEMEEVIQSSLRKGPMTVICRAFDANITTQDLLTLKGLNWLNDQIINTYFTMVMERSKKTLQLPRTYVFNTFFYPKLVSSGHVGLKRWTRKIDIFSYDLLLIPLHLGIHWATAVISLKEKYVHYYDSMGSRYKHCLGPLLQYLVDESLDKKKTPLDVNQWTTQCVEDIPQQTNGSDCGVFCCKFAEYASRGAKFTFSPKDMPYYRRRMIYEIVKQELLYP